MHQQLPPHEGFAAEEGASCPRWALTRRGCHRGPSSDGSSFLFIVLSILQPAHQSSQSFEEGGPELRYRVLFKSSTNSNCGVKYRTLYTQATGKRMEGAAPTPTRPISAPVPHSSVSRSSFPTKHQATPTRSRLPSRSALTRVATCNDPVRPVSLSPSMDRRLNGDGEANIPCITALSFPINMKSIPVASWHSHCNDTPLITTSQRFT